MDFFTKLIILGLFSFATAAGPSHDRAVVCTSFAVPTMGVFNSLGITQYDKLNLNLCSHLIYVDYSFYSSKDPWDPSNGKTTDYDQFETIRSKFPHLNISLGILQSADEYYAVSSDKDRRKEYVESAVNFIRRQGLDGLDLFWSYSKLSEPKVARNSFVLLVKELSQSLNHHGLFLSSAFDSEMESTGEIYDYSSMSRYLTFIHFMSPDRLDELINLGISPKQVTTGIMFNGFDDNAPATSRKALRYDEICDILERNEVVSHGINDDDMVTATYRNGDDLRSIRYESTRTVANKTRNAVKQDLAGVLLFTVDMDDANGKCPSETDTFDDFIPAEGVLLNIPYQYHNKYPLLHAVNDAIVVTLDEIKQQDQMTISNGIPQPTRPVAVVMSLLGNLMGAAQNWVSNTIATQQSNIGNYLSLAQNWMANRVNQTQNE